MSRLEVIDHTMDGKGRILVAEGVLLSIEKQDRGKTVKVFLKDLPEEETDDDTRRETTD